MNSFLRNSAINAHLRQVPKSEWPERVEALILIGIKSLRGEELTQTQLWSIANSLFSYPSSFPELESELCKFKQGLANTSRSVTRSKSFKKTLSSIKQSHRRSIPNRTIPKDPEFSSRSPNTKKVPGYLKRVNSKIKPVVQKDRKLYKKQNQSPRNNAPSEPLRNRIVDTSKVEKTPQRDKTNASVKFSPTMEDILINLDSTKKDNFEFSLKAENDKSFASPQKRQVVDPVAFSPFVSSIKKTSYSMMERTPPSYMYSDDP